MPMGERIIIAIVSLTIPLSIWMFLYWLANFRRVPMVPLKPWLVGMGLAFMAANLFCESSSNQKWASRFQLGYLSVWLIWGWVDRRTKFATISARNSLWRRTSLMVPRNARIPVKNVENVSPWYMEKLGLHPMTGVSEYEGAGAVGYKFNEDGLPIILATRDGQKAQSTPLFFAKKIEKMRGILRSRGIETGNIVRDRQGIRFFEIHDPEGNAIEVVEG